MAVTIRSAVVENPMYATRKPYDFICLEPGLWLIELYVAGIGIFGVLCSCDLDLDRMTFIYEFDPYSLEIYRMCKYELHTSRLSKVIV